MPSLVDQIFEQAKLGTAVNPDANPYATGVQLGHDQQRINLAQQQLAAELAMQPLQMTLKRQEADLNAIKLDSLLTQREDFIKGQAAMLDYSKQMKGALLIGPDVAQRFHASFGMEHPDVLTDPGYQKSGQNLDAIKKEYDNQEYRLLQAENAKIRAEAAKTRAEADAKAREDTMPQLKTIDGVDYITNPRTGHFERASKTATKADFISKHILAFTKDNMLDEKTAADRLSALYDEKIAPLGKQAPTITTTPTTGKVRVKHPDGRIGNIPASQLSDALANGYKQVE